MAFSLIPDIVLSSIYDIDGEQLIQRGITLLLADLDNTVVPYGVGEPTADVRAWTDSLHNSGVELFILSNSRRPGRASKFAQALGVPYLGHAGKPKTGGFQRAMEQMGRTPAQTAMVGDQMFTDILGARRAGVLAIAVRPIQCDNPFRMVRYAIELPFRAGAKGARL